MKKTVSVRQWIHAPVGDCYAWLADSDHDIASQLVFFSKWHHSSVKLRNLVTVAGWLQEETTEAKYNELLRYKLKRRVPGTKTMNGQLTFFEHCGVTRVTWTVTFDVAAGVLTSTVGLTVTAISSRLYRRVLRACAVAVEG